MTVSRLGTPRLRPRGNILRGNAAQSLESFLLSPCVEQVETWLYLLRALRYRRGTMRRRARKLVELRKGRAAA